MIGFGSSASDSNIFGMWLFSSAATDVGSHFMKTIINGTTPIHEFFLDSIYVYPDFWFSKKTQTIPTKGHLEPSHLKLCVGFQNHKLKNEYSGRRY